MEELLLKMARQLDELDQASLEYLWSKYAEIVNAFEPTKHWEEAVIVLSFIQAKYWKNRLFNIQWAMRSKMSKNIDFDIPGTSIDFSGMMEELKNKTVKKTKATVLKFTPEKDDEENKEKE